MPRFTLMPRRVCQFSRAGAQALRPPASIRSSFVKLPPQKPSNAHVRSLAENPVSAMTKFHPARSTSAALPRLGNRVSEPTNPATTLPTEGCCGHSNAPHHSKGLTEPRLCVGPFGPPSRCCACCQVRPGFRAAGFSVERVGVCREGLGSRARVSGEPIHEPSHSKMTV